MRSKVLHLQPYQRRVVIEAFDLQEKLDSLRSFFDSLVFTMVLPDEQQRLRDQYETMSRYLDLLDQRVAVFETTSGVT